MVLPNGKCDRIQPLFGSSNAATNTAVKTMRPNVKRFGRFIANNITPSDLPEQACCATVTAMRSDIIKRGAERAPHRGLLRSTGVIQSDADFDKPFIAIANSYTDVVPGHVHLKKFAEVVKAAVRKAGGVPFEFNTIAVDDGIAMGHIGMRYSLPSRELIADAVETMVERTGSTGWFAFPIATRSRPACCSPLCASTFRQSSLPAAR